MRKTVIKAWGRILRGRPPALAIELTNKCPLSCPGCYAYQPDHLSGIPLTAIQDLRGDTLVDGILQIVEERKPLGIFLVGGEPLVRVRELKVLLPELCRRGVQVEVVTSGIVPIPREWRILENLNIVVSIDGLQPQHDLRRKPATYEKILENIEGQRVIVHCTVTSQMAAIPGSLGQFVSYWSARPEVFSIRFSLYTPQMGERSEEILSPASRSHLIAELATLSKRFPKLRVNDAMIKAYSTPPTEPDDCIFARVTECISADLRTPVVPCQLGGRPDCSQCGCVAAVGMQAVGLHTLPGGFSLAKIFRVSDQIGRWFRRRREARSKPFPTGQAPSALEPRAPAPISPESIG